MVQTRAQKKAIAKSNRRRLKKSKCRGKGPASCRGTAGCSVASGKKRSFCRTRKNRTRRSRNQKGGFLTGLLTAARQSLLPVLIVVKSILNPSLLKVVLDLYLKYLGRDK